MKKNPMIRKFLQIFNLSFLKKRERKVKLNLDTLFEEIKRKINKVPAKKMFPKGFWDGELHFWKPRSQFSPEKIEKIWKSH